MSKSIERILVPLDGSQNSTRGLDEAILIAKRFGATITGLHIVNIPTTSAIRFTAQQRKKEISYAESIIENAIQKSEKSQVRFKARTETGDPKQKIAKVANDGRYDLVVIGSRGRSPGKEVLLGSVSNYVLHKAKPPVLVVK